MEHDSLPPIQIVKPREAEPWTPAAIRDWLKQELDDRSAFDTMWLAGLALTLGALAVILWRVM